MCGLLGKFLHAAAACANFACVALYLDSRYLWQSTGSNKAPSPLQVGRHSICKARGPFRLIYKEINAVELLAQHCGAEWQQLSPLLLIYSTLRSSSFLFMPYTSGKHILIKKHSCESNDSLATCTEQPSYHGNQYSPWACGIGAFDRQESLLWHGPISGHKLSSQEAGLLEGFCFLTSVS